MLKIRDNVNINDLHMDAQTRQLYIVIEEGTHLSDFAEEGFRNFDSKTLTEEEEHFIKKSSMRGQRRKLQLYGDNGERES